ncbi:MAG: hypothetical protein Q8Q95_02290 [bacterium]|nr:hypothetical protein [bacterium]
MDGLKQKFEDSSRLYGGNRENGGLANVNYNWSSNRNDNIAGRPLVVSKQKSALFFRRSLQSLVGFYPAT